MSRPFVIGHEVTFEETSLVGNVYFAHYVRWQGHCRERFLAAEAPGVVTALAAGTLALVTVSCAVDYHAEAFAGDVVELAMRLAAQGSYRVAMTFDYQCDGTTIAAGRQEVACMSRSGSRTLAPVALPDELTAALARYAA